MKTAVIAVLLATAALVACDKGGKEAGGQGKEPASGADQGSTTNTAERVKIKFKDSGDREVFSIKWKSDGAKAVDGRDQEIVRIKVKGDKLKLKDASDKVLAYVTGSGDKIKLKDAEQKTELFVFKRQDDGDYKLKNGGGELIYEVKKKNDGWKIKTADEREHARVKVKASKTVLRDASDTTIYESKDNPSSLAVVALAFDELPLAQRIGLFYKLQEQR